MTTTEPVDNIHTVEITGDPDYPTTWKIKFTCHGTSSSPCHRYPECDCESWPFDEDEHEHPYSDHDECWLQSWFDNDNIAPSTDTLGDSDYRPGMFGPITAEFEDEYVEWEFAAEVTGRG